jgi:hypothetical protein
MKVTRVNDQTRGCYFYLVIGRRLFYIGSRAAALAAAKEDGLL